MLGFFLFPLACAPAEEAVVDPGVPVAALVLPDVSDLDLPAIYADALALALTVRGGVGWTGHVATLGMMTPGCPDLWVGPPEGDTLDLEMDAPGMSWADHCSNDRGVGFAGSLYWESHAAVTGSAATLEGEIGTGERRLVADALVGSGADARFELDGEVSDAVSRSQAPGYDHWTWSSLVQASLTGADLFAGTATPGGYRADLYLAVSGGDVNALEARGNLYLYDDRLADRFDSVAMDLVLGGECGSAPSGWLSLRDRDANWYDLVFDAASCDGCGALYLRGVAAGEVCPDLSLVWDGRLAPASLADFVLSSHDLP